LVNRSHKKLSLSRQCDLLSLHRSGLYYRNIGESSLNLELKKLLEQKHLETPVYGVPRLWQWLRLDKGYSVSKSRVERICRDNNIRAIYPKPNLSKPRERHKKFPYLLGKEKINKKNQVWQTDITYIPMKRGTMYLMAVIDVYSRYVLNWSVSNTMTSNWCCSVLSEAIAKHGSPEILNTDQGSQFTSDEFVNLVVYENNVKLSMDGKGRALDNIFIERLWRTIKYEYIFLNPAEDGEGLRLGIDEYFRWYNTERRHQSLNYNVPSCIYFGSNRLANVPTGNN
jgi:putative transposase